MSNYNIKVLLMDEASAFIRSLPIKVQRKITFNYRKVEEGVMDKELFKKLEGSNIWEFRTLYQKIAYRLFAFWDTESDTLIVATHGIIKKTQKTPSKEIAKAEKLKEIYFNNKKQKKGK